MNLKIYPNYLCQLITCNRPVANAKWYADTYWSSYNSAYRDFNGSGGDCTNFISQAMKHGGWADDLGWYQSTENWWYNSVNQTYSWTGVPHFYEFTDHSGRGWRASYFSQLNNGDVLQAALFGGSMNHSMIITSKGSGDTIYLTYHTTDTHNKSIWDIMASYPSASFYGWVMY